MVFHAQFDHTIDILSDLFKVKSMSFNINSQLNSNEFILIFRCFKIIFLFNIFSFILFINRKNKRKNIRICFPLLASCN